MSPEPREFDDNQNPTLEMAYVLFMDIVGYSRMPTDVQQETLRKLQQIVRSGKEFQTAQEQKRLISLPTGDGMALAFFTDPEGCVRCAVEITRALKGQEAIPMRMGMHAGPVFRVVDINANQNVAGEGINIAQRVMDCGDAGHILVSKSLADVLRQLTGWMGSVQDLGEVSVKHGVRVHVFNLLVEGTGNPNKPKKFDKKDEGKDEPKKERWQKPAIAGAGVVLAAAIVVGIYFRLIVHPITQRPKIALLGFQDQMNSSGTAWVNTSLTENLTGELEAGEKVVTTPSETVSRMKIEFGLPEEISYSAATMGRIHNYLQCDYVVYGSYFDPGKEAGGRVKLNVRMQDAKTGEILVTLVEEGTEQRLADLAAQVGAGLRAKLNLSGISMTESAEIQASTPSTAEASRFYFDGVRKLRMFDLLGAQVSLQNAIKEDPNFSLGHADLAEVWKGQGYDEYAKEEARKAFDLSSHLGREDKTRVQALDRELSSDWEKAADLYRSLWNLYREKPEYAFRAAEVQIRGGKAKEALGTVAELLKQPGAMAKNPVIDLREAEAYEALGDPKNQAASASKAAEKAHALGARLLEAEALWRVCAAKNSLGDTTGAGAACRQSGELAKPAGDLLLVARGLTILGQIATAQGNLADALSSHRQAMEFARKIGSRRDVAGALINIGYVLDMQGDHPHAAKSYEEGLAEAREINDQNQALTALNNLALENQTTGQLESALKLFRQSLETAMTIQDKGGIARAQNNIGTIYSLQGNFSVALRSIQNAITGAKETGMKSDQAGFLYALGDVKLAQGELAAAEQSYQSGIAIAKEIHDNANVALGELSLGILKQQGGKPDEALAMARQAMDEFHAEGIRDQESQAKNLIASSLLDMGRPEEAGKEMEGIRVLSAQDATIRLEIAITEGRVHIRLGDKTQGKKGLASALAEARKMGIPGLEYEARLAMGEMGRFGGDKREAVSVLLGLEKEASRKGFRQVEARAKEIRQLVSSAKPG